MIIIYRLSVIFFIFFLLAVKIEWFELSSNTDTRFIS